MLVSSYFEDIEFAVYCEFSTFHHRNKCDGIILVCACVCVCVCLSICLSVCICLCICISVLLHCEWWKCDCDAFYAFTILFCLCLAKATIPYWCVCVYVCFTLVLDTLLHYYRCVISFIFLAIHSEYIMPYNIIYKLHRINLCHLRHMNFTVYTHTHTLQEKRFGAVSFIFAFLLYIHLMILSHFAGLCYYCHPVHRISVYFFLFNHWNDTRVLRLPFALMNWNKLKMIQMIFEQWTTDEACNRGNSNKSR